MPIPVPVLVVAAVAAALLLFYAAVIALAAWASVKSLSSPTLALEPRHEDEWVMGVAAHFDEFAVAHGYAWLGAYRLSTPGQVRVTMLTWQRTGQTGEVEAQIGRPQEHDYFCVYTGEMVKKELIDFVTAYSFDPYVALTTTTSIDGMMFPGRPGVFKQCFPDYGLDHLLDAHTQSRRHLEAEGLRLVRDPRTFESLIVSSIQAQMAMIRARPLWPLRAVWWYLTRGRHAGRAVWARYDPSAVRDSLARATPLRARGSADPRMGAGV